MNTVDANCNRNLSLRILTVGTFGSAVAKHLVPLFPTSHESAWNGSLPGELECSNKEDIQVLIAWRPVPRLCEFLDEASHRCGNVFIPLIVDSPTLRLGPIIVPRTSSCWRCWSLRAMQHSEFPRERAALLEYYASDAQNGPAGYLEPFAMMAAAKLAETIRTCRCSPDTRAGEIWQMDMFTRDVSTGRLMGIDDCTRCGLGRNPELRTFSELQRAFSASNVTKS